MSIFQLRPVALGLAALIIALIILAMETVLKSGSDGTLLLTLSFWIALIQGPVVLAAVADVSEGRWIRPLKYDLLAFYPLILFMAFLFLILYFQMEIFPWMNESHRWLNADFFILRNFFMLVISFLLAHFYVKATVSGRSYRGKLGVLFILSFIVVQSMVGVDWIMSLEYPWISTMFPPLFFVESFYAGLAVGAILAAFIMNRKSAETDGVRKVMRDMALFMFGFALAWAGLYYGQFLVVWYGNIPWETSFFAKRMHDVTYNIMMYLIIIILFILPFVGLVSRKAKTIRTWVVFVSIMVLMGILLERIFYILPVLHINPVFFVIEFILVGFLFYLFAVNRDKIIRVR